MLINEIFVSISGEAARAGFPVIFIRTFGCNLKCSYCDSLYAIEGKDYKEMTVCEIIQECLTYGIRRVVLTGGEPLLQKDAPELVSLLCDNGFEVEIETNGAVDLRKFHEKVKTQRIDLLSYTMDYKTISSEMSDKMIKENLEFLSICDVIKFVVGSQEDLEQMKDIIKYNDLKCRVFASPVFGKIEPKDIVKFILDNDLRNCRFQLQIHKFVWPSDMRGV